MSSTAGSERPISFITSSLLGVAIAFPVLSTIAVLLRFYALKLQGQKSAASEWVLVAALISTWGISIDIYGGGVAAGVQYIKIDEYDAAVAFLKVIFINGMFLAPAVVLVKVSILLFYKRIFIIPRFALAVNIFIGALIAWMISSWFCIIFSSNPVWGEWDPEHNDIRYNFAAWAISLSAISIASDLLVLAFPLPVINRLHVTTKRKWQIIGIFWLGAFCTIAAVVRAVYEIKDQNSVTGSSNQNRYLSLTLAFTWATIEPNCSIIAACLPFYAVFFQRGRNARSTTHATDPWSAKSNTRQVNRSHQTLASHDSFDQGTPRSQSPHDVESQELRPALKILQTRSYQTETRPRGENDIAMQHTYFPKKT